LQQWKPEPVEVPKSHFSPESNLPLPHNGGIVREADPEKELVPEIEEVRVAEIVMENEVEIEPEPVPEVETETEGEVEDEDVFVLEELAVPVTVLVNEIETLFDRELETLLETLFETELETLIESVAVCEKLAETEGGEDWPFARANKANKTAKQKNNLFIFTLKIPSLCNKHKKKK